MSALILLAAGCSSYNTKQQADIINNNHPTTTSTAEKEISSRSKIVIENFLFKPESVTISQGGTVTWVNKDTISHAVFGLKNDKLQSPQLGADQSYSFTYTAPGSYQYYCPNHPSMVGTIIVK